MCKRNIEDLSCNHFCRAKASRTTYTEYVPVALIIRNAKFMRRIIHILIFCLSGFTNFFHIVSLTALFSEERYGA